MTRSPTALLIIRAWVENGSSKPLRAQIRLTTDVASGITVELTQLEIDAVAATVTAWLNDVLAGGASAADAIGA